MPPKNSYAPYMPTEYEKKHVASWQALTRGQATEHQQRLIAEYIVHVLCGTYDLPYFPDSVRDSDFAQGKRFIGLQLVKFSNLSLANFQDKSIISEAVKRTTRKRIKND